MQIYFTLKGSELLFLMNLSDAKEYQCPRDTAMLKIYFSFSFYASVFEILIKVESLEVTDTIMNAATVQLIGSTLNKGTIYKLFIDMYFMINRWSSVLQLPEKHISKFLTDAALTNCYKTH